MENFDIDCCCCFTGYRPTKFPFSLLPDSMEYIALKENINKTVNKLINKGVRRFYTGMASGFDLIAAMVVLNIKKSNTSVQLVGVIPYPGQADSYAAAWKNLYDLVIENCDYTVLTSNSYHGGCFNVRNMYMVDNCRYVISFYDGKPGGTKNTVMYAKKNGREIFNMCEGYNGTGN